MNEEIYRKATVIRNQLRELKDRLKYLQQMMDKIRIKSLVLITENICFGDVIYLKESENPALYQHILEMGIIEIEKIIQEKEKIYAEL
jgi:hypothetical protein